MKHLAAGVIVLALATSAQGQDLPLPGDPELPAYREGDASVRAYSVLPPGRGKHPNLVETLEFFGQAVQPAHNADQVPLYTGLVAAEPTLTDADLPAWFKDHAFHSFAGPSSSIGDIAIPRQGAVVVRDGNFGIPHVYGETRADVAFAAGWDTARTRLFVMDVLRHLSRGRLSELLGASESNLAFDRGQQAVMDYSEKEIAALADDLVATDPVLGPRVLADLAAYAEGVNLYIVQALTNPVLELPAIYPVLQIAPKPWTVEDSLAITTLVGGLFSPGGGGQLRNEVLLRRLESRFGDAATARAVFADFRRALDPETPTTVDVPFPFNHDLEEQIDPAAVARPDDPEAVLAELESFGSPTGLGTPVGPIPLSARLASNALLVGSDRSASGNALAVMGPQIGYWSPEVVYEMELHGPGVDARGITVPGMGPAVIIGRGPDWSWSLTTAIADHQDIRAVRLCDPTGGAPTTGWTHYRNEGACDPMLERVDVWLAKPSAGGLPETPLPNRIVMRRIVERTRHGMVVARGTVGGAPVAFVRQRSSYGKDARVLLGWTSAMDPARNTTIEDLRAGFADWSLSFNIFLIHGSDIGYVLGGIYPKLRAGVDPDRVFWGDAEWDWDGTLDFATEHPTAINPPEGYIVNWNNSQAPLFRAADSNYSFGSVHRSLLLEEGLETDPSMTLAEVVQVMERGATKDLRVVKTYPLMQAVLGSSPPASIADAVAKLDAWHADGGHRRDLDGDGLYEHREAILLMDRWWPRAIREVFEPVIGASAFEAMPFALDDTHAAGGGFTSAWHGIVNTDLRFALGGVPLLSRHYCAASGLSACRDTLVRTLEAAVAALDPTDPIEDRDANRFTGVGLIGQEPMPWQNRPTYQQVLELGGP